ncbi:MAG: fibronectin type III domain-containing protein, partial [Algicola sp.]|nr:fibronectin type III domain-containing protein [Algicola sp.]
ASGCTSAPNTPSGLNGSSQAISWQAASGAPGYNVQYWTGSWSNHGNATSTSYTLGLSGTQYVRIRATNSCGNSGYTNWITVY